MVNSYDNTIVYLDNFINIIIKEIEKKDSKTLLIYLSDHGEILGENNLWLDAQKGKASENPAMLIWCSSKFNKEYPNIISNLKMNKNKKTDLDFFYNSILYLFKIENIPYDKNKVIF